MLNNSLTLIHTLYTSYLITPYKSYKVVYIKYSISLEEIIIIKTINIFI